ncbi:MAG: hypothetical protein HZC55_11685 [Verrucomicrobia bacterium]|nr:hypothetical protein [Verrucomicrobiota bacterium]
MTFLRRYLPAAVVASLALGAAEPPVRWVVPSGFDPKRPALGLPALPGVSHEVIYAPVPSRAAIESGGDGRYESALHGTYNHHTRAVRFGDKVIVYWTNHSDDENGPGQRIVARWGILDAAQGRIDWGDPAARTVELASAPVPVHRRVPLEATGFDRRYVRGDLRVIEGRLRFDGGFMLNQGWTDDPRFRMRAGEPVPEERFRAVPDADEAHARERIYRYDMFWTLGPTFRQLWEFTGGALVPASALHLQTDPPASLALTATQRLALPALLPPYGKAPKVAEAAPALRALLERVPPAEAARPHYAPGTSPLAADGRNALAHRAEFRRRDGTWVILRDNLARRGHYYAAAARAGEAYPPAVVTNLYGDVMPAAGELPDGRVWVLGNSIGRFDFFLTLSDDGTTFDRSWHVLHINEPWREGFAKPPRGGPQYPHVLTIGNALWVFYSIGKERIGVTRIPFSSLAPAAAVAP